MNVGNWKTATANLLGLSYGATGRAIFSTGVALGLISGTPSNPPSGSGLLYLNNSGVLRLRQSDGTDTAVGGGGGVESVTGLNTDNTDPANPVVAISVDGTTITGAGTPGSPLVAAGGSGVTLQVDGVPNTDQSLLNLIAGTNVTLTDDGVGGVTIDVSGVPSTVSVGANLVGDGSPGDPLNLASSIGYGGTTVIDLDHCTLYTNDLSPIRMMDWTNGKIYSKADGTTVIFNWTNTTASGNPTFYGNIDFTGDITGQSLSLAVLGSTPSAAASGFVRLYKTADGLFFIDDLSSINGPFITTFGVNSTPLASVGQVNLIGGTNVTLNAVSNGNVTISLADSLGITNIVSAQAFISNVTTINDGDSPYPVTTADSTILVNPMASSVTAELPATPPIGRVYTFKMIGTGTMVIDGNGRNIDGSATKTYTTQYDKVTVQSDGTNWWIIG